MGKGIYEFEFDDGQKAKFIRQPDGRIQYWRNDKWHFTLGSQTWRGLVTAMEQGDPEDALPHSSQVGEIIGWRCWRLVHIGGGALRLWSLHRWFVWSPLEPLQGFVGDEEGGIYAFKDHSEALTEALRFTNKNGSRLQDMHIVIGRVRLWGDVIEAERGWRAQFGAVHSVDQIMAPESKPSPPPEDANKPGLLRRWRGWLPTLPPTAPFEPSYPEAAALELLRNEYTAHLHAPVIDE